MSEDTERVDAEDPAAVALDADAAHASDPEAPSEAEATPRLPAESATPEAEVPAHPVLGGVDLAVGLLLLGAIWFALPARWLPLDIGASLLALGFLVAGATLLARKAWALKLARILGLALLVAGASLVTALALAASDLYGRYGPVGMGGGLILFVVFLLLLPYVVIFPAAQLWVLGRPATDETR